MTISQTAIPGRSQPGLCWRTIRRGSLHEFHATFWPLRNETGPEVAHRLVRFLDEHEAALLRLEVFGAVALWKETLGTLKAIGGKRVWPVTWAEGKDCKGARLAGMHLMAVSGTEVHPLKADGAVAGVVFEEGQARHCFLGGMQPDNPADARPAQLGRLYERVERALVQVGMDLSNLVRTWFYLDEILSWYGDFNEIRNEVYVQRRLMQHLVPASTGIGARNPGQTAAIFGGWAVRSPGPELGVQAVGSPLQCSAPSYGSCFSRAIEMTSPNCRRLLVSGTASIDGRGTSVCREDIHAQVELTMRVLKALLASRQLGFQHVTRSTAYLKRAADAAVFEAWRKKEGLEELPMVITHADVCRDELLFELELDAVAVAPDHASTTKSS